MSVFYNKIQMVIQKIKKKKDETDKKFKIA